MTHCSTVRGPNGRPTYTDAAGGASSCTECPEIQQSLQNRLRNYSYFPYTHDRGINSCIANINDDDPDATFRILCYYRTSDDVYGGPSGPCQIYAPLACVAGKYSTIDTTTNWLSYHIPPYAACKGVDCMNGKVCTDVDAGYYSPDGDTEQHLCDTPPANAHITTACTAAANTVWACNSGYGRTAWDTCEPLCGAGITTLRTSNGLIFNLYANKLTSPAVHIKTVDGTVCYVNMASGNATGAINTRIGDTIYHTTN